MPEKNVPYAYDFDGLSHIFLANGFLIRQTRHGEGVSFYALENLSKQICVALALRSGRLRGNEFRFVRRALELTQGTLATMFGRTELTVANWEKTNKVPLEASLLLKQNCLSRLGFSFCIEKTLDQQGCKEFSDEKIVMEFDAKTERWSSNLHPAISVQKTFSTKTEADFDILDVSRSGVFSGEASRYIQLVASGNGNVLTETKKKEMSLAPVSIGGTWDITRDSEAISSDDTYEHWSDFGHAASVFSSCKRAAFSGKGRSKP